jgi:hypothetical protein
MDDKIKIIQFQKCEYATYILLSNGKVYCHYEPENGGAYWIEETWLDDLIKDLGLSELNKGHKSEG